MTCVLMFGWEFPPYISGGLGTACFGLTKSLSQQGVKIKFVLPALSVDKTNPDVEIVNPSDVCVPFNQAEVSNKEHYIREQYKHLSELIELDTLIQAYNTEESYRKIYEKRKSEKISSLVSDETLAVSEDFIKFKFKGGYGEQLKDEVFRLAIVAEALGKQIDFDVIHAHDWMTYPAGVAAKKSSGKPLVVHVHATEFDRSGESVNQSVYDIERMGMHEADRIIAVSNRTKDIVVFRYGIDPNKVDVVHNGSVEMAPLLEEINRPFKEKTVLFLGRITMQKGPGYFIDAANIVLKKKKNVRFIMAGDGDMMKPMVHRAAEYGIMDRFHFTGFLRGDLLKKIFLYSDLFVMPSVSEPFGIVPIEAMHYGVPVIVSKQSGVSEVLPDAVKIDFWDIQLLAEKIIEILYKPEKTEKMILKNSMIIKELSWDKPAELVTETYQKVMP